MSRVDNIDYSNYIDTIGVEFEEQEDGTSAPAPDPESPDTGDIRKLNFGGGGGGGFTSGEDDGWFRIKK